MTIFGPAIIPMIIFYILGFCLTLILSQADIVSNCDTLWKRWLFALGLFLWPITWVIIILVYMAILPIAGIVFLFEWLSGKGLK